MADLDRAYQALTCPMPECGEQLYVRFDHTVPVMLGHLDDRDPIGAEDGDVGSWKVECIAGHVVLVPARPGCWQDDVCAGECTCDVDHGDEARTFRASDMDRLRELIAQISGVNAPNPPEVQP